MCKHAIARGSVAGNAHVVPPIIAAGSKKGLSTVISSTEMVPAATAASKAAASLATSASTVRL